MEENKKKKDHSDVEVGLIIASVAVLAVFIIFMIEPYIHPEWDQLFL